MSFLIAAPDMVAAAATDLASIGSTINTANAAASALTTSVAAAAADEVSTAVAHVFDTYAQEYQTFGAHMAAFHDQFVQTLKTGALAYTGAEAANASPLQELLNAVNAPTQALLGRPLIGNGTDGAPGTGADGGAGGLLWGNGGNGGSGA
ncbi:PE family protein, partial [Mycobacterium marinum]